MESKSKTYLHDRVSRRTEQYALQHGSDGKVFKSHVAADFSGPPTPRQQRYITIDLNAIVTSFLS